MLLANSWRSSRISRNTSTHCAQPRNVGIPLPDGSGFLSPPIAMTNDFLYGPGSLGFLLSRDTGRRKSNQELGLIRYQAPPPLALLEQDPGDHQFVIINGEIVALQRDGESEDLMGTVQGAHTRLLESRPIAGMLPAPHDSIDTSDIGVSEDNTTRDFFGVEDPTSPRRTLRVSFKCNKCGARNVHNVNPVAWKAGTVFIECGNCKVKHKMVDHLNLSTDYGRGITLEMTKKLARDAKIRAIMPDSIEIPDDY